MTLTVEGYKQVNKVISHIFAYLDFITSKGVIPHIKAETILKGEIDW